MPLDTTSVFFLETSCVSGLQHHKSSTRWPSRGWSDSSLCPVGWPIFPRLSKHQDGSGFYVMAFWMALLFPSPSMSNMLKALVREQAANPLHQIGSHQAIHPTCWQSISKALFNQFSHGSDQLQQHHLLGGFWHQVDVLSQGGGCVVTVELKLPLEVYQQLSILCRGHDPCRRSVCGFWLFSSSDKGYGIFGGSVLLCRPSRLGDASIGTVLHQMPLCNSWGCVSEFLTWNTLDMLVTLLYPRVQFGWTLEHVVYCLKEEPDVVRLSFHELSSGHFLLNHTFPSRRGSLLFHSHCAAGFSPSTAAPTWLDDVCPGSWKGP